MLDKEGWHNPHLTNAKPIQRASKGNVPLHVHRLTEIYRAWFSLVLLNVQNAGPSEPSQTREFRLRQPKRQEKYESVMRNTQLMTNWKKMG